LTFQSLRVFLKHSYYYYYYFSILPSENTKGVSQIRYKIENGVTINSDREQKQ